MIRSAAIAAILLAAGSASATVFCNPIPISVPGGAGTSGPSTPYPTSILVGGQQTSLAGVKVLLHGFTHTFPGDLDILLVAPNGGSVLLMSDAGGDFVVNNVELVIQDGAPSFPEFAQIVSGSYAPTNFGALADPFNAPAPAGPYGSTLGSLNGINPNGVWQLFVMDDAGGDIGAFSGGWCIEIEAVPAPGTLGLGALALAGLARRRRR